MLRKKVLKLWPAQFILWDYFKPLNFFDSFSPSVKDAMATIHEFSNDHDISIASIACLFARWARSTNGLLV